MKETSRRPRPTGSRSAPPEIAPGPRVRVVNRQRAVRFERRELARMAQAAVPLCLAAPGPGERLLAEFAEVEVAVVSDAVIARVHADFSGVPGATDVITFLHGELVVSAETARRAAEAHGEPVLRELLRYIVHGLLHLHGHLDDRPARRKRMWLAQEAATYGAWGSHGRERKSQNC